MSKKLIILECEESKLSEKSGVSRYIVEKNEKDSDKIEKKKWSPILKKYTIHKEK